MSKLNLITLLLAIEPDTEVWITTNKEDPDANEGMVYFGPAEEATLGEVKGYRVISTYPERYPSKHCVGITIIVEVE